MDGNGGIRVSLGMVAAIFGLLLQFGGLVFWLATEHANQVELSGRVNEAIARANREVEAIKSIIDLRNNAQDKIINKLDEGGSRKVVLLDERQQAVVRRVEVLERLYEEQRGREDLSRSIATNAYEMARDTYYLLSPEYKQKLQQFAPNYFPPKPQEQQFGPGGGITVGPNGPPIIHPPQPGTPPAQGGNANVIAPGIPNIVVPDRVPRR
jgi:hypothetical protein